MPITEIPELSPSCNKAGRKKYWFIERTGKMYDSPECVNEVTIEDLTIAPLGHSYIRTVVPPTLSEQGYTLYECENCGDTYKDS